MNLRRLAQVAVLCCFGMQVQAASEMELPGQPFLGLVTDSVTVADWPKVQRELVASYGAEVTVATSGAQLQAISDAHAPAAYVAIVGPMHIFSLLHKPIPDALRQKTLALFPDIDASVFDEYDQGLTFTARATTGNNFDVSAVFMKDRDGGAKAPDTSSGIPMAEGYQLPVPAGTEILTKFEGSDDGVTSTVYSMSTTASGADTYGLMTSGLKNQGLEFQEESLDNMAGITVYGDNFQAIVGFEKNAPAQTSGKSNVITVTIAKFEE